MRGSLRGPSVPLVLLACAVATAACSSDPIDATGDGDGAGGMPAGGSGGEPPKAPRDYSDSPCYGEARQTQVYDGETHAQPTVNATCRGEGERTRLYVADDLFGTRVTQAAVNGFLHRFEVAGSAESFRADLGVLATNEAVFGALRTELFPEGKLPVFLIDSRGGGDGYLCGWCAEPELHLDALQVAPLDGDQALSIAAHESFHAIHRGLDANEEIWVDESLAQAAMAVNGFFTDQAWLRDFLREPNVKWGPSTATIAEFHYGGGLLFGTYLWEQGGPDLMSAATAEPLNGWEGLDAALAATGNATTAFQLFLEMAVAVAFDDPLRGKGFKSFDFDEPVARTAVRAGQTNRGQIAPYGLVFRELSADVVSVRVDGGRDVFARWVVDADPIEAQPIELGAEVPITRAPSMLILTATRTASFTIVTR